MIPAAEVPHYMHPDYTYRYIGKTRDCESWLPTDEFRSVMRPALEKISESKCRWYVYAHCIDGEMAYIGKGCGNRISYLWRTKKWIEAVVLATTLEGRILSWHDSEDDAYMVERALVATLKPRLNHKMVKSK